MLSLAGQDDAQRTESTPRVVLPAPPRLWTLLGVLLVLLSSPGLTASAAEAPPSELVQYLVDVATSTVQELAVVALGKTGDRKILPLLEALREGSVYVRALPGGGKETVIAGDKVTEGDKTLVPLFSAYGREALTGADGKPLLVDVASLQEVPAGRSLRLALRPIIDGKDCWRLLLFCVWVARRRGLVRHQRGRADGSTRRLVRKRSHLL